MKKKINLLFITLLTIIIGVRGVEAQTITEYNANNSSSTPSNDCPDCKYGNLSEEFSGIRITLVDKDGNRIPDTHSIDYTDVGSANHFIQRTYFYSAKIKRDRKENIESTGVNGIGSILVKVYNPDLVTMNDIGYNVDLAKYMQDGQEQKYFENYFTRMATNNPTAFNNLLNSMADNGDFNSVAGTICNYKPYFIIEPLTAITDKNKGDILGTITELSLYIKMRENSLGSYTLGDDVGYVIFEKGAFYIYMDSRVGELNYNPISSSDINWLMNYKTGNKIVIPDAAASGKYYDNRSYYQGLYTNAGMGNTGYAMGAFALEEISNACPTTHTCYKASNSCNTTTCDKKTISGAYDKITCLFSTEYDGEKEKCEGEDESKYHRHGVKLVDAGTCNGRNISFYCTESSVVNLPGNVVEPIELGKTFNYPTTLNGRYPLYTKSTLTCKLEFNDDYTSSMDASWCNVSVDTIDYQKAKDNDVSLNYERPTYTNGQIKTTTETEGLNKICRTSSKTYVNGILTINYLCNYTLDENKNVAIDAETGEYINKIKNDQVNDHKYVINIERGIATIDSTTWRKVNSEVVSGIDYQNGYKLTFTGLNVGDARIHDEDINTENYVCSYGVTTDNSGSCTCPPGTEWNGFDLTKIKSNTMTCAEAQTKFCEKISDKCPPEYDPNGEKTEDFNNCLLNKDKDYSDCVVEVCKSTTDYCELPDGNKFYGSSCDNGVMDEECRLKYCNQCPLDSKYPDNHYNDCLQEVANDSSIENKQEYCIKRECYEVELECPDCRYFCPIDSRNSKYDLGGAEKYSSDKPGMEVTNCVNNHLIKGEYDTVIASYNACISEYCNTTKTCPIPPCPDVDPCKGTICSPIYRTVSLNNPFPGKSGLGRTPGSNWESLDNSIRNIYITYNRGYEKEDLYKNAEPLYVIELNPSSIKAIREYNRNQKEKYADWDLNCTDGAYCISKFLHETFEDIVTGGTCMSAKTKEEFEACYTCANGKDENGNCVGGNN